MTYAKATAVGIVAGVLAPILIVVILALLGRAGGGLVSWSWRATLGGIFLFSGSLYIMALYLPKTWAAKWLAGIIFAATPLGGLLLMTGWLLLALSRWRREP